MTPILQIVFILVAGTVCQIIGWRYNIPSILLLLLVGISMGPVLGIIAVDDLVGNSLMPLIELAVAVILFEGGLSLKSTELGEIGVVVLRIISIGALVTWALITLAASGLLNLQVESAAVLGAILVISGPTVVVPLLRTIHARPPIEAILRWEGILIDPIGVVLAVLIADACQEQAGVTATWRLVSGFSISLSTGMVLGWLGALFLKRTFDRHLLPDQFIVPLTLVTLFALVLTSNQIHDQSGLLTSTILGMLIAHHKVGWVQHIEMFISNTQRIFIGVLFIALASRLKLHYLLGIDLRLIFFILVIVVVIRPVAVLLSTIGTKLSSAEKLSIAALAPRGIVSAALASTLELSLSKAGVPGAQHIESYTYSVIIGTVAMYSYLSPWIFGLLKSRLESSQGVLLVGGGRIALAFAVVLKEQGFKVAYADTSESNCRRLAARNIPSYQGNILSESTQSQIELSGIGNLIALTSNDEANSLAVIEFRHILGSAHVFQVALAEPGTSKPAGRIFGHSDLTLDKIEELWSQGYRPFCRVLDQEVIPEAEVTSNQDYVVAHIEGQMLYFEAGDTFQRPTKPEKQIIFGLQSISPSPLLVNSGR